MIKNLERLKKSGWNEFARTSAKERLIRIKRSYIRYCIFLEFVYDPLKFLIKFKDFSRISDDSE